MKQDSDCLQSNQPRETLLGKQLVSSVKWGIADQRDSKIVATFQGRLSAMTAQLDDAAEIHPSRPWGKPLVIVG